MIIDGHDFPPITAAGLRVEIVEYLDLVFEAAGRDPRRLAAVLDELKMRLEERRLHWLRSSK